MDGKRVFAEIFLDNVVAPVTDHLGEEGRGWQICMATAGFERGLMLRSPARYQVATRKLIGLYHSLKHELPPSFQERVALLTVVCTGLFSEGIPVALCWPTNLATLTLTAVLPVPNKS